MLYFVTGCATAKQIVAERGEIQKRHAELCRCGAKENPGEETKDRKARNEESNEGQHRRNLLCRSFIHPTKSRGVRRRQENALRPSCQLARDPAVSGSNVTYAIHRFQSDTQCSSEGLT